MELFDLFFWCIGRLVHKVFRSFGAVAGLYLLDMVGVARLHQVIYGQLMAQSLYKPLYDSVALQWDTATQTLALDVSALAALLQIEYDVDPEQGQVMVADFGETLEAMGEVGVQISARLRQQGHLQGQGFELLLATLGDNLVVGTAGADTLDASTAAENLFVAGQGNDILRGGAKSDLYQWSKGDGNDTITEVDGTSVAVDTLQLMDVDASQVRLSREADNLYITIGGEQIKVVNNFGSSSGSLERIQFSDGSTWQKATLDAAPLMYLGTGGNDTLAGTYQSDTLEGAKGADSLNGYGGSDTYVWAKGDGNDVINEYDQGQEGDIDTLKLTDVSRDGVQLSRDAYHLYITVIATGEKIQVSYYFNDAACNLERIEFAGGDPMLPADLNAAPYRGTAGADKLLLDTQVQQLVQAMAAFAPPPMGQTTLTAAQQTALAPVLAANWQ